MKATRADLKALAELRDRRFGTDDALASTTEFLYVKLLKGGCGKPTLRASVSMVLEDGTTRAETSAQPGALECLERRYISSWLVRHSPYESLTERF